MPVVRIKKSRIKSFFPDYSLQKILEQLPFLGLDIESIDENIVRVEYNPNRPDFSSDIGIFRALNGLVGRELGIPKFNYSTDPQYKIIVDNSVKKIRPFIFFFIAKNKKLTQDSLEQIISMQEDLHNGIARGRKKASIGIHDLDKMQFPLRYSAETPDIAFVPLDQSEKYDFDEILNKLTVGQKYKHLVESFAKYPVIFDKSNMIVSFPPIINSDVTKITKQSKNLLLEITATHSEIALDMLSILSHYFLDEGFEIVSGSVNENNKDSFFPLKKLCNESMVVKKDYINNLLGLELSSNEIIKSLKKVRIDASKINGNDIQCAIPHYRSDITNTIDVVEEVALGYGIYNLEPSMPSFKITSGIKNPLIEFFNELRKTLIGFGLLEVVNFSLVDQKSIKTIKTKQINHLWLKVNESKSSEHEFLRTSIIPSLMNNLSHNIHEEYPQKIFEIGKVFSINKEIAEKWCLGVVMSSNNMGFTETRSLLRSIIKINFGEEICTKSYENEFFITGRSANIYIKDSLVGVIGEVSPKVISEYNIRVPVSAFEIVLSDFIKTLN